MLRERIKRATLPPAQENIEKLEKVVNDGNYYGAQQMYKSISARYIIAKRYSEALDILQSGSCLQLQHGQVICGAELAVLFVETLVKGKFPYDDESLDRVRKIYKMFPEVPVPQLLGDDDDLQKLSEALGEAKTRVDSCASFLKAAIKWSAEFGAHSNGSPKLHVMLAEYLYYQSPESDIGRVSYHFVRGDNPKKFASTLLNFLGKCYTGEDDIAIARAVLMYLSIGNLRDANILWNEIKQLDLDFSSSDLIQFITYLLLTLQRDALPLFNMLRVTYKSSLAREPEFNELLDEIAEKFYGVQRRNPLQGMFGDIFKMMG
ncbi:Golgi to ER traffic protein 4 homolog isoform X2 [Tripterygium wilfordii]|uniref:Golgi to ER traffic protein 4 homolog isoform X2 n=1 Tax=Tripterygium wilfordii TaxID=458696 RepID=UPI0018F800DE|nr:Golgi to ER traffic protein 4 homolog isoform X2 [Tripterygium wilfordii]